ncbi:MAG TPA: Gfo/Idh/MocA family oxidoreductase [Candidatus Hydrogenedentes bacterium]|nr:Gfo/Idh/MocA family oxidoreductase [Candidatus Hydrogenedentota bacterium]HPG68006.1 Gfo/Idh/MocA family oxidoreductase [Candidatus Hydrogenedentota bacterium]
MRLGIVDLDTSHPQNWIPIERELGHEVVGVWDGGTVHPAEYVDKFATEHGIPCVFESLEQMIGEVDGAIIHGCDWDTHVAKARPFVEAGKSVLIDKPIAGNLRDIRQFAQWAEAGARICGGSSLRFCCEVRDWLARPIDERGTPHTALCGCAVDDFNYGIHAYAMLSGLMGAGISGVRHLAGGTQHKIQVNWRDGKVGFLVVGKAEAWMPFYATVVTEKGVSQFQAESGKLYRALLESVLPYMAGEVAKPPMPFAELIEPELCALAARRSWLENDREVALAELTEDDAGYDGAAFGVEYRKARYG